MKIVDNSITYQMVTVHIDRINVTNCFERKGSSKHMVSKEEGLFTESTVKPKKEIKFNTNEEMSAQTRRKMQKAIKYLNFMTLEKKVYNRISGKDIKMKLSFVTCTLCSKQIHTDNEIKSKLVNQFLIEAKNKWKVKRYVWRCEKQLNRNAHFHFIFDNFVPLDELRETWNRIQNKLGYVDRYSERMKNLTYKEYEETWKQNKNFNEFKCRDAFRKGKETGFRHPNCTDVHSLMFINDIDKYLIKYMQKSEQNKGIEGRMWGCSRDLSDLKGGRDIVDSELAEEIYRLKVEGQKRYITDTYFDIIFIDWFDLEAYNCVRLMALLRDYLFDHFSVPKEYY
jgi:hypothetical protein